MAEIWGAALVVAGTVYSANKSAQAAKAGRNAAASAAAQSQENYNQTKQDLQPYIGAGANALTGLEALNNGNYSGFINSPDYQFALDQGLQGVDRSGAARGSLYSGGHTADVLKFAGGLASQNLGNYRSSLMSMAQMGQGAASNLGSVGQGNAASIGGYTMAGANATAQGAANQANIYGSGLAQLGQIAGQYQAQNASSYIPPTDYQNAPGAGAPRYANSDITWN